MTAGVLITFLGWDDFLSFSFCISSSYSEPDSPLESSISWYVFGGRDPRPIVLDASSLPGGVCLLVGRAARPGGGLEGAVAIGLGFAGGPLAGGAGASLTAGPGLADFFVPGSLPAGGFALTPRGSVLPFLLLAFAHISSTWRCREGGQSVNESRINGSARMDSPFFNWGMTSSKALSSASTPGMGASFFSKRLIMLFCNI